MAAKLPIAKPAQADAQEGRTLIELLSGLNIYSPPVPLRKTGIICTIGPSCRTPEVLKKLISAGMCIARLNFSHGDHAYHTQSISVIRQAADEMDVPLAIALDTKGPEIRTSRLKTYAQNQKLEVELKKDAIVVVTTDDKYKDLCDENIIHIDYKNLAHVVHPGSKIYMADGLINLEVTKILSTNPGAVECRVVNHARLGSQKGVNLPGARVDLPAISEQDARDLAFGCEQGVDMVFASFIRKRQDILDIRKFLDDHNGKQVGIIAKIENDEGVQNFDDILAVTDGVMVARGDLGIEIPSEKVFLAQKMMIAKCNRAGKPVICATQMLESMISAPRPTRAEGTDVANAVLDGSDCVMLSGETAKGDYPVEAVTIMAKICQEAESAVHYTQFHLELKALTPRPLDFTEACCVAAVDASLALEAKAIVTLSISGTTGKLLSKWRPFCPVLLVTRNAHTARYMRLYRGIHTILYKKPKVDSDTWLQDVDNRVQFALDLGKSLQALKAGDTVVVVHGWQTGPGFTNTVRILTVS